MVKRYFILLAVLIFGVCNLINAQDAHFSQFYSNPIYLNPALAGAENCPRVTINYRNQWPGLGQTYVTYSVGYDQYISAIHGGIGIHLLHDNQAGGAFTTSEFNAMYAYTLPLSYKVFLTGALQTSFFMHHVNYDFVFPDMIHPLYGPIYSSLEAGIDKPYKNHFDASLGLLVYTEKTFLGVAVHHITKPSISFIKTNVDASLLPKVTAHFGVDIDFVGKAGSQKKGGLILSPQVLYQQQGMFQQFNWGLYVKRSQLVVGVWARQNFIFHYDALTFLMGYRGEKFRLAYSYDLTVSELVRSAYGAHEVSLAFLFDCRVKTVKRKAVNCPSF